MKQSPKTMIKCKFSNEIHKLFNSLLSEKEQVMNYQSKLWWLNRTVSNMSDKEKSELLDDILKIYAEASTELGNYRSNKRQKKIVQKARVERGYIPKKKTSKEEYLKSVKPA